MDATVSDGAARRSLLDQLGPRARRRPVPRVGAFLGAAGGALLVAGLVLLSIDAGGAFGGDGGDGGSFDRMPGILIGLLSIAAGLLVLHQRRHGALASAATVLVGAAIPGVLVLAIVADGSGSMDTVLALAALAWAATYLVGPARGRAILLGLALFGAWSCAMSAVGGTLPLSPLGLVTFQAELDSGGDASYGEGSTEDFEVTAGSIDAADLGGDVGYDDRFDDGYDDGSSLEQFDEDAFGFGAFQGPDLATMGAVSLGIGAGYLVASRALDRRGRRGMSTPFVAVGLLAVVEGVVSFVAELHLRPGSVVVIAAGIGLAVFGADTGRRIPTALGAVGTIVGLGFLLLPDVDSPAGAGGLLLLGGAAAVAGGHVLGAVLREGDEAAPLGDGPHGTDGPSGDDGGAPPPPPPAPEPDAAFAPPAEEDPGVPVLVLEPTPVTRPTRKAPAKRAMPTKQAAAKQAATAKQATTKQATTAKQAATAKRATPTTRTRPPT